MNTKIIYERVNKHSKQQTKQTRKRNRFVLDPDEIQVKLHPGFVMGRRAYVCMFIYVCVCACLSLSVCVRVLMAHVRYLDTRIPDR